MFTGIVSDVGQVVAVDEKGAARRFRIACNYDPETIALGASIACAGPCHTVIDKGRLTDGRAFFDMDTSAETLARTTLGTWNAGTRVNLERSLSLADELGGHLVTGHVDGTAEILARDEEDGMARFTFRAPADLARFIAGKGSVALDGASLTVNGVEGDIFRVMLIPHSLAITTWGERRAGDRVNLEVDLMARYAARLAEAR